ncbi:Stress response protein SCP2 [Hyella patelloides LEGE 07179]|uniref:Stress response protein SCP2 n=1 Tax=Hyella patelloides LEGE 07179 TaxID=945734 RepID=A0A563VPE6_9CYAN|nr:TerD family protein [Hyella patelloides]VEP13281.1 Stress response protein SCP2 [Hyella patelloides LEGE 07179]
MSINLQKGQRISLKKEAPNLSRLMCGLGWDVAPKSGGWFGSSPDFDLDAFVICLNENQKLTNKSDIVYFGNLRHSSQAITHLGDNLTGDGKGDDEQIIVDLPQVPTKINKLLFLINIYDSKNRKQELSQVKNAFVRLVDLNNNQEIARYKLSGSQYQNKNGLILGEVYRHDAEWKMAAIGDAFDARGIADIAQKYA